MLLRTPNTLLWYRCDTSLRLLRFLCFLRLFCRRFFPERMTTPTSRTGTKIKKFLRRVYDQDPDSALERALIHANWTELKQFKFMDETEIDNLKYIDNDGDEVNLESGPKAYLKITLARIDHMLDNEVDITENYLDNLTHQNLLDFCRSDAYRNRRLHSASLPGYTPTAVPTTIVKTASENFRRGIKHDMTLFKDITKDEGWEPWHRHLITTCRAQNLENIRVPIYTPADVNETELFDEQKTYMYAVFERTVKTQTGIEIVRKFHSLYNAQAVYEDLVKAYESSTRADIESNNLFRYISSANISSWKGKTEDFVLHWQDKIRVYNSMQKSGNKLKDEMQRILLQNSVSSIPELDNIKVTSDKIASVNGGKIQPFSEYLGLVKSAMIKYDKRVVQQHLGTVVVSIKRSSAQLTMLTNSLMLSTSTLQSRRFKPIKLVELPILLCQEMYGDLLVPKINISWIC